MTRNDENLVLARAITAALDTPGVHPGNDSWGEAYNVFFNELHDGATIGGALDAALDVLALPYNSLSDPRRLNAHSVFYDTLAPSRSKTRRIRTIASQATGSRWYWLGGAVIFGVVAFVIGLVLMGVVNWLCGWAPDGLKYAIDFIWLVLMVAVGVFVGGSWALNKADKHKTA